MKTDNGQLYAELHGVPKGYDKPLTALLDAGDLAYTGASKLNADGKWAYSWYLFLPLGMALENRKSVELLHFPPDYSLTQAQDYLRFEHHRPLGHVADRQRHSGRANAGVSDHHRYRPDRCAVQRRQRSGRRL